MLDVFWRPSSYRSLKSVLSVLAAVALMLGLSAGRAAAADVPAQITGTIRDTAGTLLPGATVTAYLAGTTTVAAATNNTCAASVASTTSHTTFASSMAPSPPRANPVERGLTNRCADRSQTGRAAGAAWGLFVGAGLVFIEARRCGVICLDDAAITLILSMAGGIASMGPLAAFGRPVQS